MITPSGTSKRVNHAIKQHHDHTERAVQRTPSETTESKKLESWVETTPGGSDPSGYFRTSPERVNHTIKQHHDHTAFKAGESSGSRPARSGG
jgi:hypothetical protein